MIYFGGTIERTDFYQLWQQHQELRIMQMNEASPGIYNVVYEHQPQPRPTVSFLNNYICDNLFFYMHAEN